MPRSLTSPATAAGRALGRAAVLCGALGAAAAAHAQLIGVPGALPFPPDVPGAPDSGSQPRCVVPPSVRASELPDGRWRLEFTLAAKDAGVAARVQVAGTFTNWQGGAVTLERQPDGSFAGRAVAIPGEHRYKFILDGTRWIADPANGMGADDHNGGTNSVLRLGPEVSFDASRAAHGDGEVEGGAVLHDPRPGRDVQAVPGGIQVRVRTLRGDVDSAELVLAGAKATVPMRLAGRQGPFDVWEAVIQPVAPGFIPYTFLLKDGPTTVRDPNAYSLDPNAAAGGFRTPEWAKHAVWYQVMVDRFRNGDRSNDPEHAVPWTLDWYKRQGDEGKDGQTFYKHYVFDRFAGGDLAGLRAKLPYLKELGVNALYLLPVFQASTPHKYNTTSYVHIDEHFGTKGDYAAAAAREDLLRPETWTMTPTDRAFVEFLADAKRQGFRVIVDGVFNHCGTGHPAFQDVKRNGQKSAFADWFDVKSWDPFQYESWWGFSELPVYRKDEEHGLASQAVRDHIFAITRRWMDPNGDGDPSDGVDGWRLDVPADVPIAFWHEWCAMVRKINPDAYIAGEIWERADRWLDGRAFDAVMNYEFTKPAIAWAIDRTKKIRAGELDARLAELRIAYPAEASYAMMNLVDSHDTDRVASMARNPDRTYNAENREQDGAKYDASKPGPADYARQRLLALLQVTYVGAPMIFYGDEVGMWGSGDPNNRKPMLWEDIGPPENPEDVPDLGMLRAYRELIALRNAHPALRTGSFRTVLVDDAQDVWAFLREGGGEQVLVALCASGTPATVDLGSLGTGWQDAFGTPGFADDGLVKATIPAVGGRVWVRPTPAQ